MYYPKESGRIIRYDPKRLFTFIGVGGVWDVPGREGLVCAGKSNPSRAKSREWHRRDYKQSVYEGGIRVPFIVRWPGKLPKGAVCDEPVISLDILPTICAAVGAKLPDDRVYDGKNMLPVLRAQTKKPLHKILFWDDGIKQWAVREGKWKLLFNREGSLELYDLQADISEKNNLAKQNPEIVKGLQRAYQAWKNQMAPQLSKARKGRQTSTTISSQKRKNRKNR